MLPPTWSPQMGVAWHTCSDATAALKMRRLAPALLKPPAAKTSPKGGLLPLLLPQPPHVSSSTVSQLSRLLSSPPDDRTLKRHTIPRLNTSALLTRPIPRQRRSSTAYSRTSHAAHMPVTITGLDGFQVASSSRRPRPSPSPDRHLIQRASALGPPASGRRPLD